MTSKVTVGGSRPLRRRRSSNVSPSTTSSRKSIDIALERPVVKDRGDVRVPKPRGSACFAQEAFPCFGVLRDAGVDDLESHVIAQDGVKSLKRDAHRPSAQLHWRAVA